MVACYYLNQVGVVPRMTFTEKSPVDVRSSVWSPIWYIHTRIGVSAVELYLLLGLISHPHPEYIKKNSSSHRRGRGGCQYRIFTYCTMYYPYTHSESMGRWGSDDVQQQLSFANTRYNIREFCGFAAAAAARPRRSHRQPKVSIHNVQK